MGDPKKPYVKPEMHTFAAHELIRAMRLADETRGRREGAQAMLWLIVEWARTNLDALKFGELKAKLQTRLAGFSSEENAAEIALRTVPSSTTEEG